jgi:antitoxin (DNA-binding transcriptional repressor) of toxin-antitoxin stability system
MNGNHRVSATRLRQNLYSILDSVLETGVPVEIERKGKKLKIVPEEPVSKWDRLEPHDIVNGDPRELVHLDWSDEWKGRDLP